MKQQAQKRVRIRGTSVEGTLVEFYFQQEGRLGGNTMYYVIDLDSGGRQEYQRNEIKALNFDLNDLIEKSECKDCGYKWNPAETEHGNFECCPSCNSTNVS